jgi:DnaJ-class molecular chaperone
MSTASLRERVQECPDCRGNGWRTVRRCAHGLYGWFEEPCETCKGSGYVPAAPEDSHDGR